MILYESDWFSWPTAIPDMNTKNTSFIRLAAVYRAMGIKNHAFMLALVDQNLKGIDPFDPNLTEEQMLRIAFECKINPWYFFREIARVPSQAGAPAESVQANRANMSMWWSFFNHVFYTLIQPRQTGKSISVDWLMEWLMWIRCTDTNINLLTKDDALRRKNVQRLKDISEELPEYLQQRRYDDTQNGEEITVKALGNHYTTHVPQSSEKRALNMGRGFTTPVVQIDEPPFQAHIGLALPAMLAGMGAAIERAKKANAPYGVVLTTTAGRKDDRDGKWVYTHIVLQSAAWSERFLDAKNAEELEAMIKRHAPTGKLRIIGNFDHRMLGKTDQWLRERIEEALQEGQDAERDYLNTWTSGTARSPFSDPKVTEAIANSKREPKYQEIFSQGYILRWHIPQEEIEARMAQGRFIMGADTSEAIGRDDICVCVIDTLTGEVVAAGNYNETNLIRFSEWLGQFLVKYKNITLIPERKSTGTTMIDHLLITLPLAGEDPFRRIFNRIVHERDMSELSQERYTELVRHPLVRRTEQFYNERKQYFGYATAGAGSFSRNALYSDTLTLAAKRCGDRCFDSQLVEQILGLVNKNGRIDHEDGMHDDMVIAWLLTHWLMKEGKNLQYYGIDSRELLMEAEARAPQTHEEYLFALEQEQIRQEIEGLYMQLSEEEDEWVQLRIEQKLRTLDRRIVVEAGEFYSLDELIRSAKDKRRNASRRRELGNEYQPMRRREQTAGSYEEVQNQHIQQFGAYGTFNNVYG